MPPAAIHELRTGSFTLSRILFRASTFGGNTPEIPLGLLSEIVVGPCRVLGMSIRREITPREASWLPDSWQADLARPATYWSSQFDECWASAPSGQALNFLAERHQSSLYVAPPQERSTAAVQNDDSELRDTAVLAVMGLLVREEDKFLPKPTYPTGRNQKLRLLAFLALFRPVRDQTRHAIRAYRRQ